MGPLWLRTYDRPALRADVLAGVMLAAYLLPAGIADASIAGLPPEAGLYACLFSGLVFWALSSSRHTAITVTSAISILVGTAIGDLSGGDQARHVALAMTTGLVVGGLGIAAWALRAGMVVNFVSETVLVGFKCGIAFVLAGTQVPKLLGFAGGHGSFWSRLDHIARHIGETHPASLALGVSALVILLAGKRLLPGKPVALVVVVAGLVAALIMLAIVLWFSALLQDLPQPVLAAIVLAAVAGLINVTAIMRLWRFSGVEFSIAAFAFLGVLGEGILRGVAIGVLLSLFALLKRASAPNVVELGRIGQSTEFASITDDTPRTRLAGTLVARVDGSLLYFNVEHVRDRLMELLAERPDAKRMVLYLGAVPALDLAGADMVIELGHALDQRGIAFRIAGAHTRVRDRLISAGMDDAAVEAFRTVASAAA